MFTESLALKVKEKFVYELKNNIPDEGGFEEILHREKLSDGFIVEFSLSSILEGRKRMISVTAKKDGRTVTKYLIRESNSKILEWIENIGEKELSEKAGEAVKDCKSFYYP